MEGLAKRERCKRVAISVQEWISEFKEVEYIFKGKSPPVLLKGRQVYVYNFKTYNPLSSSMFATSVLLLLSDNAGVWQWNGVQSSFIALLPINTWIEWKDVLLFLFIMF